MRTTVYCRYWRQWCALARRVHSRPKQNRIWKRIEYIHMYYYYLPTLTLRYKWNSIKKMKKKNTWILSSGVENAVQHAYQQRVVRSGCRRFIHFHSIALVCTRTAIIHYNNTSVYSAWSKVAVACWAHRIATHTAYIYIWMTSWWLYANAFYAFTAYRMFYAGYIFFGLFSWESKTHCNDRTTHPSHSLTHTQRRCDSFPFAT